MTEEAVFVENVIVSSHLDYCNSLFRGLWCFNLHKWQFIQNTLAYIVTNHRKYVHVTHILKRHHSGCLLITAACSRLPHWFTNLSLRLSLSLSSCFYTTRHSHPDHHYLTFPPFHSSLYKSVKHVGHIFAFCAPKIWNELPDNVRSATSFASFR